MSSVHIQPISEVKSFEPLNLLHQHGDEWAARQIGPYAVLGAIQSLIPRPLKEFEERDIIASMNDRLIGNPANQGEL